LQACQYYLPARLAQCYTWYKAGQPEGLVQRDDITPYPGVQPGGSHLCSTVVLRTHCTEHLHRERAGPWLWSLPPFPIHTPILLETSSSEVLPPSWAVTAGRKRGRDCGSLAGNVFLRFPSLLQVGSCQPNAPLQKVSVETIEKKKDGVLSLRPKIGIW